MIIYYVVIMIICGSYGEICAKWYLYQFEEWTNNSRKGLKAERGSAGRKKGSRELKNTVNIQKITHTKQGWKTYVEVPTGGGVAALVRVRL